MAGTTRPNGSRGENISHINAIRMRVVGSGNLELTLYSLDDVDSQALVDITMSAATAIQPTRLANFWSQRVSLELKTDAINEYFRINRVIMFTKELYSSYPG